MTIKRTFSQFRGGVWVWDEFTTAGTWSTWSQPSGVNQVYLKAAGAGAGGGGAYATPATTTPDGAGGGGGGQIVEGWYKVTGNLLIWIGLGGTGGTGGTGATPCVDGHAGEDTVITGGITYDIIARGGEGGIHFDANSALRSYGGNGGGAGEQSIDLTSGYRYQISGQGGFQAIPAGVTTKVYPGPGIGSAGGAIGAGGGSGAVRYSINQRVLPMKGASCAGYSVGGPSGVQYGGGGGGGSLGDGGPGSTLGDGEDGEGYGAGGGGAAANPPGCNGGDGIQGYALIGYVR